MRLPGGILIPVLGFAAAAVQLPSLGLQAVLIGIFMMIVGGALYASRQWQWLAGDLSELKRRIRTLETPLTRALRTMARAFKVAPRGGERG